MEEAAYSGLSFCANISAC